jgi:ABC-type molybdate transport system substrate-binding protein
MDRDDNQRQLDREARLRESEIRALGTIGMNNPDLNQNAIPDVMEQTKLSLQQSQHEFDRIEKSHKMDIEKSKMALEKEMQAKLRPMSGEYNVEGVASGEVDMIVVVASRIYGVPGVQFLGLIPKELQTWIGFSAGVGVSSKHSKEAEQLTQFFTQSQAKGILKKIGIEPVND